MVRSRSNIPKSIVKEILMDYLDDNPDESITKISERLGFNNTYMTNAFVNNETMEFRTVDKLLCAINKFDLWYEEPLETYYWEGEVPPDKTKPVKCVCPDCDNWFNLPEGGGEEGGRWNQIYCSNRCKKKVWNDKNPDSVREQRLKWESKHPELRKKYDTEYRRKNKEKILARDREYARKRREAAREAKARSGVTEESKGTAKDGERNSSSVES